MTPSLEMMFLQEMMKGNSSFFDKIKELVKKEEEDRKKAALPKPITFSPLQTLILVIGLGPFMGTMGLWGWAVIAQHALDAIRSIH